MWEAIGTARHYTIWRTGPDGREVYQMTYGDPPSSIAGYRLLETLLSLKGMTLQDYKPLA